MPPTYEDVERAIAEVDGVASASVGEVAGSARERLRIRLEPGHDPDAVAVEVARTLSARFGVDVDPAAIQPQPAGDEASNGHATGAAGPTGAGDPTGAAEVLAAPARPRIHRLAVSTHGLEVHVDAVLTAGGRDLRGQVSAAATPTATLRAVARATLAAVEEFSPGRLKTELETLERSGTGRDDEVVTVTVTLLTYEDEVKLLGASLVRGDVEHAVMRATLDAVNRRIGLLAGEPTAS